MIHTPTTTWAGQQWQKRTRRIMAAVVAVVAAVAIAKRNVVCSAAVVKRKYRAQALANAVAPTVETIAATTSTPSVSSTGRF